MTNREINEEMKRTVGCERQSTLRILTLINLAEEQKTHLELGYGSLHDWLIKEHKYSERSANRRIQSARLMRAVPAVAEKIEDGRVNISTLAKAQSMIRTQEKVSKVTAEMKAEAVAKIENLSEIRAEQSLMSLFPENISQVKQERVAVIDENTQRLTLNFSNEVLADLERVRQLLSHAVPSGKMAEVIGYLAKEFIKRKDPVEKPTGAPLAHRIRVIKYAGGACTYKDPVTGKVCGSKIRIERDHIKPRAMGGDDSPENARALCRAHNQFMSEKAFGKEKANHWRRR